MAAPSISDIPTLPDIDDDFQGARAPLPLEQLEAHARQLSAEHGTVGEGSPRRELLVRLERNAEQLEQVYKKLSEKGVAAAAETPSEEWLRDNHYVVRAQLLEIRRNLPRRYYDELPRLTSGRWKRYPRVYVFARDLVTHTAGRFTQQSLRQFADAYQDVTPLTIGELWAIPIMLRLALVENLCALAVRTLHARQEREAARAFAAALLQAPEKATAPQGRAQKPSTTFVVEMLHNLRDQSVASTAAWRWLQSRLDALGQSPDEMLRLEHQREAIDQLSIANVISTMRALSALDWPVFVEAVSRVERILRRDPSGAYADMDRPTRDRYRKSVEQLSRRSKVGELEVAERAIALCEAARRDKAGLDRTHHVGYYLISRGRFELERVLNYRPTLSERIARLAFRHPALGYLGGLAFVTALFESSLLVYANNNQASALMLVLVALATAIPVSELAVSFVNTVLTTIIPPRPLPKLALRNGVPDELRTVVAIPTILSSPERVRQLVDALEVRALANDDANLYFALLGDFPDADAESLPGDQAILEAAVEAISALNAPHTRQRFFLLHRKRQWNPAQGKWMGWERKRGKLHEFNRVMRGATDTSFSVIVGDVAILQTMRYVITLDSDTDLPLDAGRKLVGTLAHPLNRARFDPQSHRLTAGYSLLQPRVAISAVSASETAFAEVFSGHVGLDPYTTAVSDIYQDLFGEGIYVGKGIYEIDAFERALAGRVPENALLSHDLFEGLFARVALCTDIEVIDEYPSHYLTWSARLHRWIRGDWQLLPWLGRQVQAGDGTRIRNQLSSISRWKILDNLRRSLLAPALLLLFALGWTVLPGGPGLWTGTALLVLFFPAYVQWGQTFTSRVRGVRLRDHFRAERDNLALTLHQLLLHGAFLAHQSVVSFDAVLRTLSRLKARKHLLDWQTAADAAASLEVGRAQVFRRMWVAPAIAAALGALTLLAEPASIVWAVPVLLLWSISPVLAYQTGLQRSVRGGGLEASERREFRRAARLTWRFFEELVTPADNWLVPDNRQDDRPDPIAHRTSPTNIGLQLMSTVAAWDFGYISAAQCLDLLDRTCETLRKLPRYRGHLFNWYDTTTLAPLAPLYVSTVDSGNLLGYLITLTMALDELVDDVPTADRRFCEGLADTLDLIERDGTALVAGLSRESVREFRRDLRQLRARCEEPVGSPDQREKWLGTIAAELAGLAARLHDAQDRLSARQPDVTAVTWSLDAAAAMVKEQQRETARFTTAPEERRAELRRTAERIRAVAEEMIATTELDFLFDKERFLFAIGYNVTEGRRDSTYYDSLASEARLASFLAIALRHVPQEHWFKLGRLMTPVGQARALVSWSASMFEYLMPLLIMRTYPRTLLNETYEAIVTRHIEYARALNVPWGISESAYNVQDGGSNYQYRAFGVPGIGLKRGLGDDLVVAPYASMLAAPLRPREVLSNLEYLASEGALGPLGYYEAVDYTKERLEPGQRRAVIRTYMAHHQGMTLMALDNCVHDNVMQRRFHGDPRVQAAELLLQERSPHLVPLDFPPEEHKVEEAPGRLPHTSLRRYATPHTLTPRGHLLSNGALSVMVTNAGGGYTRWRDLAVTRWREDATLDAWGSFCYIRDIETNQVWSSGFQPTGREAEHYEVTFAPDRAVLRRRDLGIETITEVTVSPEDDAEIRRVSVTNHSSAVRELELTSYLEVVLAPHGADLAHPAFSNLFVESRAVPELGAVIFTRRPRAHESSVVMGHLVATRGRGDAVEFETDREEFVGRSRTLRRPKALDDSARLRGATGAVLDPVASLRVRVRLPAGVTARVSFVTVVADSEAAVRGLLEKYHDPQVSARAFALASTHSEIELRHLGVTPEEEARFQRLGAGIIYPDPRLRSAEAAALTTGSPPDLWKFGISGDLPLALVTIRDAAEVPLARDLVRAQEYLRGKGLKFDLVILNEIPVSYRQDVQDDLQRIADSGPSHLWLDRPGGLFLRRADNMNGSDRTLLRGVARVMLEGSRGSLDVQLRRPALPFVPPPTLDVTHREAPLALPESSEHLALFNGYGGFADGGREYQILARPPAPWSNVVANPVFGFIATDSGFGSTWSENSYQNRLTPWHNDPIVDPPSEVVYLRDDQTGEFWGATPAPVAREITYRTRMAQGFVAYQHAYRNLDVELLAFVPAADPVKLLRLRVANTSDVRREVSAFYYADWCLSDHRERSVSSIVTSVDAVSGALFARNRFRAQFGARVAFMSTSAGNSAVTGDRGSFIGRNSTLSNPHALGYSQLPDRVGPLYDPCGAVQAKVPIEPHETVEIVFVLGEGSDEVAARELVQKYGAPERVNAELDRVVELWNRRLSAVHIETPDAHLNVLTNRWLPYQALACRFYARSAFYQSGGAFGFRDQLQDVLAFLHFEPAIARAHIVRAAGRQFPEGDVQHWWHEPGGEGVRTRIQDDRLWLVYAVLEYIRVTGDWSVLDATAPLIEQRAPGPDEHSVYERPTRLPVELSIYEHCVKAIARTMDVGAHGLPLIGTGDWNDGMDEVGAHGQGESVWLGWFLASLLEPFAAIADRRGEHQQAAVYRSQGRKLKDALDASWDGEWFRRAYFDDGTPLGSKSNAECRIDAIAQSWAVISGLARPDRAQRAMQSLDKWLVDREARLILLLAPPFDTATPSPGYIRGYVPGVRENGGQYTHAALWVVLAQALLRNGDRAYELLGYINPVCRSMNAEAVERYRVEPYVLAADIYSARDHLGRGGWTWYTGAAGWMYRIVLEHLLGIRREGDWLRIDPCIPAAWSRYAATLRVGAADYRIEVENPDHVATGVRSVAIDGRHVEAGLVRLDPGPGGHTVRVVMGARTLA